MSKVKVEMNIRDAAAVRQILFEHQKGYSYDYVPQRIAGVREVIQNIDAQLESRINKQ